MTTRARRLEKFLRMNLDWETRAEATRCENYLCESLLRMNAKFCHICGEPAPKPKLDKTVIAELESAIVYALKEKK